MKAVALLFLIGIVSACGDGADDASEVKSGNSRVSVCMGKPIPTGYVIVEHKHTFDCGSGSILQDNTNVIKKPGASEVVCSDSPIPDGYVEVETLHTLSCTGGSILQDNASKIRKL